MKKSKPIKEDIHTPKMILYHAVSMYQILCVISHRLLIHRYDNCILLLPDFITTKWENYMDVVRFGFFDEVYLFPYLKIPHNKDSVFEDVSNYMSQFCYGIDLFSKIYVAGAHFYFSSFLLKTKTEFCFFEDAPGLYAHPDKLFEIIKRKYYLQADFARENGLLDAANNLITQIYCAQCKGDAREVRFDVIEWLKKLKYSERKKILNCFGCKKIEGRNWMVIFTQQFSGLGEMTDLQQKKMYEHIIEDLSRNYKIILKRHPDDCVEYNTNVSIKIIDKLIPAELLPFILSDFSAFSINSTSMQSLQKYCSNTYSLCKYDSNINYEIYKKIMLEKGNLDYVEYIKKERDTR